MKKSKRVIIWFRQDLRLHDNEALHEAMQVAEEIIPVYVFDLRQLEGKTQHGFRKTSPIRAMFLIESVQNLRNNLKTKGIDLIIRTGLPEEVIYQLAKTVKSSWVYCNIERTHEEVEVQNKLEQNLWTLGQELRGYRGKMLYYTQDLPFPIAHTPDNFNTFRKEVEKITPVRKPLAAPESFSPWSIEIEAGELPQLIDFGLDQPIKDSRADFIFEGGENKGLERIEQYFFKNKQLEQYEESRQILFGPEASSKLSPWLAMGCLSPKLVYEQLKKVEAAYGENKSTHSFFMELLWRDFFRLMGKKHGNKIFQKTGLVDFERHKLSDNWNDFEAWVNAETGIPIVDACMMELKYTGYLSNRGRQIVGSYLVHELKVNWQLGAEYFESILIDYDVCSNYVNWLNIAAIGTEPREERNLNPIAQSKRYDPQGIYIKHWLTHLQDVPSELIHESSSLNNPQIH